MLVSQVLAETAILREASFSYVQASPYCVAFKQVRMGIPSLVIFSDDGKQLAQSEKITVMQVATRKLTDIWRSRRMDADEPIDKARQALWTTQGMLAGRSLFRQFPEYFRETTLDGRPAIYRTLTTDLKMPEGTFRRYFGTPPELTHGEHYQPFHNARLFFPETMRATRQKALLAMLGECFEILTGAGLGTVFGCDVRFVQQKQSAAGLYYVATDDMRIAPQAENSKSVVFTLLHEYGHRFFMRFAPPETRKLVKEKYWQLRIDGVRYVDPQAQEKKDARSKLQVGTRLRYTGAKRTLKAIGEFEIIPSNQYGKIRIKGGDAKLSGDPAAFLSSDWQIVGDDGNVALINPEQTASKFDLVTGQWFPTKYSEKEFEEWFCECFAMFLLGHLEGPVREFYAPLIRVG